MPADENVEFLKRYLETIERRGDVSVFYHSEVVQEELPNRLLPKGAVRDFQALIDAGERGRKVMSAERYELRSVVASGDTVAVELLWTGRLAVPFGALPAGGTLRAHFAQFVEFRDGKIHRQRTYDCFEPWD